MTDLVAPITDVTVYADRALVTRRAHISLEAGEHTLLVNNLPQFVRKSLRASGQGPQGTRILNVDIGTTFYSRPPEAELQALTETIERLNLQKQLLQARQDALNDRRQWLKSLGDQSRKFAKGLAQGQMHPQDCADFFTFMSTQSLQDAEAAQNLDLQIQHVQQDIAAQERTLYEKNGFTHTDRLTATISVTLAAAGDLVLELSYLITDASWYPQYDVRVQFGETPATGNVEVTYIGMVQQTTGENWDQVALSLSTARPSLAAVLPELDPWYLNVYTPPPPVMLQAMAPAASAPMHANLRKRRSGDSTSSLGEPLYDYGAAAPPERSFEAEVATTTVEHTGTALVFHVGHSIDIPSDRSPHKTTIALDDLPCTFDYVSAPAIEPYVHLRASIKNTTERILLKGDTSIFLNGEYVGTTHIPTTAPGEDFKIFLGLDDDIKIKREPTEQAVEKGNLLQNDLRRSTYAYRITAHNYTHTSRKLIVHDHLPLSQHERIKVKVLQIQPQPTEHTKLELLTWELTLPPDGELKIEYRFVVEHPQNLPITGLS